MNSVQDPFENYQTKLAAKLAQSDQSEEALAKRAAKKAAREADRTTWLGTNLGEKGKRKRPDEEDDDVSVGKYLEAKKSGQTIQKPATGVQGFIATSSSKKTKKPGGFGDFSSW